MQPILSSRRLVYIDQEVPMKREVLTVIMAVALLVACRLRGHEVGAEEAEGARMLDAVLVLRSIGPRLQAVV
jgi:hypothetical protein